MEGVERIDQKDDTHLHWVIKIGGIEREFDATVTEQHPEERVAWKSDSGPEHAGVVTFHRLDDEKTRVTTQMDVDPEGFVENVADKLGILKARVSGDLERFKKFIESKSSETGACVGTFSPGRLTPPPGVRSTRQVRRPPSDVTASAAGRPRSRW